MKSKEKTTLTRPDRPLCLAYEEAKDDLFRFINTIMQKHGIPPFLVECMVTEAWHQVRAAAGSERKKAEEAYRRQLHEYERQQMTEEDPARSTEKEG